MLLKPRSIDKMSLLLTFALLIPPLGSVAPASTAALDSTVPSMRTHYSETLKLRCDSLPYRSFYKDNRCYFAIIGEVVFSEAETLCSTAMPGAEVALDARLAICKEIMVNASKFHIVGVEFSTSWPGNSGFPDAFVEDKRKKKAKFLYSVLGTKEPRHTLCSYETVYWCDGRQQTILGKCIKRIDKNMNFADAEKHCASLNQGLQLPSPSNDLDNRVLVGVLGNDPAWVRNSYKKQENLNIASFRAGLNITDDYLPYPSNKIEKSYSRYGTCEGNANNQLYSGTSKSSCETAIAAVIDKTGYWSNTAQSNEMAVVCMRIARTAFTVQRKKPEATKEP